VSSDGRCGHSLFSAPEPLISSRRRISITAFQPHSRQPQAAAEVTSIRLSAPKAATPCFQRSHLPRWHRSLIADLAGKVPPPQYAINRPYLLSTRCPLPCSGGFLQPGTMRRPSRGLCWSVISADSACNIGRPKRPTPSWGGRCSNPAENSGPGSDIRGRPGKLAQPPISYRELEEMMGERGIAVTRPSGSGFSTTPGCWR
jgi:hypothetical protein